MKFVIFHGSYGSPEDNWFPYLKKQLEQLDQEVILPQFPVDSWEKITERGQNHVSEIQNLENWKKTFEQLILPHVKANEHLVFVGHSLAPVFILHMVEQFNIQLDSAFFVAPFLQKLNRSWQIDVVNASFYKTSFDFTKLHSLIPISYVLYSDNDPHVPQEKAEEFAEKMNSSKIIVRGGQHFNEKAGFKEFPLLLELCKTRC